MSDTLVLETFFSDVALDFWRACTTPDQTAAEADFCMDALGLAPGDRALDAPCGNGRHSLALARRGVHVTGVDLAGEFVAEAAATAGRDGLPAVFLRRDMRDLPGPPHDGALCLGNSFGYLDHAGNVAFLAALAGALRPGARLVIDSGSVAEALLPRMQDRFWMEAGGVTMLVANRYDVAEARVETEFRFMRDGREHRRTLGQSVYTAAELGRMLGGAGFRVRDRLAGIDGAPFVIGARRLVLVAERTT